MIREAIKKEMELQKVSQSDLISQIIGKITAARISNFLSGKASINVEVIDEILQILQIQLTKKI